MANPFTTPTISNYNATPPEDDGSATATNEITWAKHKTKLTDPIKTFVDSIVTNLVTAFTRIFPYQTAAVTTTYTLQASDRGKMLNCTNTFTLTLLPAATAAANFVFGIKNIGSGTITIDGDGSETIDGSTTLALSTQYEGVELISDGSNWHVVSRPPITSLPMSHVAGLNLSNNSGDADHVLDIAAGEARDATNTVNMVLSAFAKDLGPSGKQWVVGTGNGGLDGSESVAGTPDASTMYYVWLIKRSDTAVVDVLYSESATAPTMPTNYNYKRLIGAVKTDGSANILAMVWQGDHAQFTAAPVVDVDTAAVTDKTLTTATLSVPPNSIARVVAHLFNASSSNTNDQRFILQRKGGPKTASTMAHQSFLTQADTTTGKFASLEMDVWVDGSSQIEWSADENAGTATFSVNTLGWNMLTRRDP
jgi:hypothetical protein